MSHDEHDERLCVNCMGVASEEIPRPAEDQADVEQANLEGRLEVAEAMCRHLRDSGRDDVARELWEKFAPTAPNEHRRREQRSADAPPKCPRCERTDCPAAKDWHESCSTDDRPGEATDPPLTGKFYIRCVQGGGAKVALHRDDGVSAVAECPAELVPEWNRRTSDDQTSDFGWWARFEDEGGAFGWLTSSFYDPLVPFVYTEDPEKAYRFATAAEAQKAIDDYRDFPGGAWQVVEHKDEGMGDDRNADHMAAEIERSERRPSEARAQPEYEADNCGATHHGPQGFVCTRANGHEGEHRAWGAADAPPCAVWPRSETAKAPAEEATDPRAGQAGDIADAENERAQTIRADERERIAAWIDREFRSHYDNPAGPLHRTYTEIIETLRKGPV